MSSHQTPESEQPLDLTRWRNVPNILVGVGGALAALGALTQMDQFRFAWLTAFMFFLSFCLGGLVLTLFHHLFDASWSVPIRRINEQLACLAPVMALLFIPIALTAPKLYPWMAMLGQGQTDHALHAKYPLFTVPMFYIVAAFCFATWIILSNRLRHWSLEQDKTGAVECTFRMRKLSYVGIFLFALTLTLGSIMWMKALQHQWFSTMYGVYYFAGSTWVTLATVYVVTMILRRQGPLKPVVKDKVFYFLGTLTFAFTVFYAYVTFSQYFIIWNANIPEETFWYQLREKGTWWDIGLVIIFGHFFIPFLTLLRIDVKLKIAVMGPIAVWAWLMHYLDMQFNIMPVLRPNGFAISWIDIGCFLLMAGVCTKAFLKNLGAHPIFPQNDPRMAEGLDVYVPQPGVGKAAAGHAK